MSDKLTEEQREEMKEAFDLFDRDHSGGISYHELTSVMYALGQQMTHSEVLELMKEVDTNGVGLLLLFIVLK